MASKLWTYNDSVSIDKVSREDCTVNTPRLGPETVGMNWMGVMRCKMEERSIEMLLIEQQKEEEEEEVIIIVLFSVWK